MKPVRLWPWVQWTRMYLGFFDCFCRSRNIIAWKNSNVCYKGWLMAYRKLLSKSSNVCYRDGLQEALSNTVATDLRSPADIDNKWETIYTIYNRKMSYAKRNKHLTDVQHPNKFDIDAQTICLPIFSLNILMHSSPAYSRKKNTKRCRHPWNKHGKHGAGQGKVAFTSYYLMIYPRYHKHKSIKKK